MTLPKGLSRRGFLGAMSALTGATIINPAAAVPQIIPHAAKTAATPLASCYLSESLLNGMYDTQKFGVFDISCPSSFDTALDIAKNKNPNDYIERAMDLVFCCDILNALTDDELEIFSMNIIGLDDDDIFATCSTPQDIKNMMSDLKDKYVLLYTQTLNPTPAEGHPHRLQGQFKPPFWLNQALIRLSIEDQIRLAAYALPHQIAGDHDIPINKSLKSGLIHQIFEALRETSVLAGRRMQVLDFILHDDNELTRTVPEFLKTYIIDKPFTLRELKEVFDANEVNSSVVWFFDTYQKKKLGQFSRNEARDYILNREAQCEKILRFYGIDPDEPLYPTDQILITMTKAKKSFLGKTETYDFSLIIDVIKPNDQSIISDSYTESLHDLRQTIFNAMDEFVMHDETYISEVSPDSHVIRVTVPAGAAISDFMDEWMAHQNPHDAFWDHEVPNEFVLDVQGYIERHTAPAPKLTRAGLFGRKPS